MKDYDATADVQYNVKYRQSVLHITLKESGLATHYIPIILADYTKDREENLVLLERGLRDSAEAIKNLRHDLFPGSPTFEEHDATYCQPDPWEDFPPEVW